MGLLDDAIREHLDLKRRRGADPTEVERDEHEALGPVRRAPEATGGLPDDDAAGPPVAYDHEDEEASWSHVAGDDGVLAGEVEPGWETKFEGTGFEPETVAAPPSHEPLGEPEPPPREPEPFTEAPSDLTETPSPLTPPPHPAGGQTQEYDVEDVLGSADRGEGENVPGSARLGDSEEAPGSAESGQGEDVLEETPEFLQDTPDHDRLWFEQRPPKDFDFDG